MTKHAIQLKSGLKWRSALTFLFVSLLFFACEGDKAGSLFNPDAPSGATPVITTVDPPATAFAGIGIITITGQNFSATPDQNFVFFNSEKGEVLEASATQLRVKVPNLVADAVDLKIAVFKVEQFSNTVNYKLEAAVSEHYPLGDFDVPYAITSDAAGNIYTSLVSNSVGAGIKQISPAGVLADYAPKGAETFWSGMKVAPDGSIIAVRNVRALFQIPAGGGNAGTWVVLADRSAKLVTMDFDKNGNLWTAGDNQQIYSIKPDKSVVSFDFIANVRTVRVFADALYLGGERDGSQKVWKLPIVSADQVGSEEEVFDFSASYPGKNVLSLEFAADGDMYIGTDADAGIVVVHSDGSAEPLYSGLLSPRSYSLTWGTDNFLYVARQSTTGLAQTIFRINMLKDGAPHYGRGDTD